MSSELAALQFLVRTSAIFSGLIYAHFLSDVSEKSSASITQFSFSDRRCMNKTSIKQGTPALASNGTGVATA
jgi:hypothetical protein